MHLGFYVQGPGIHWDIAKHLIASARRVMPDVPIFQLTDGETPAHEDVGIVRLPGEMPMAVRRMKLHAMLGGEWLFVDSDVVVRQDVRSVFDKPFDVAVTDRIGSAWANSPDVEGMPYNMGVTFSRNPKFWAKAAKILQTAPPQLQEWEGDQRVVCSMTKNWNTLVLPGHVYNFTPYKRDEDRSHAALIHFKGPRKAWIEDDR